MSNHSISRIHTHARIHTALMIHSHTRYEACTLTRLQRLLSLIIAHYHSIITWDMINNRNYQPSINSDPSKVTTHFDTTVPIATCPRLIDDRDRVRQLKGRALCSYTPLGCVRTGLLSTRNTSSRLTRYSQSSVMVTNN